MSAFILSILTPDEGQIFEGKALSVIIPGVSGQFEALAHHAPMVAILQPGCVTVKTDEGLRFFACARGVAEIMDNEVCLLLQACTKADSVEDAKQKAAEFPALI